VPLLAPASASAAVESRVTLAFLPSETSVRQLTQAGLSPGLMSAGLGTVPPEQTYLDITQGNRVFDSLYDNDLPKLSHHCPAWRQAVAERAESAPADIVPGLLAWTLTAAGDGVRARGGTSCTFSPGWPGERGSRPSKKLSGAPRPNPIPDHLEVRHATLAALPSLAANSNLLIAIARPTGQSDDPLAIGVAGRGFDGDLTSDSTRTNGYVLSTDVAPTIIEWFDLQAPSQMSGQPIRTTGAVDPAEIESLGARMGAISSRRGPVIGLAIGAWLTMLALVALFGRGRGLRPAVRVVGLSVVYLPLVLLGGAALEAAEGVEQLLVALAAPLLAVATLAVLDGYRALAVASALTVLAYAIDVVAGSSLTRLSLLGPNPGLGVRFYGIGNELEALLAVLVVAGTGAGLAGFGPRLPSRRCAAVFLAAGLLCAFVFAAGRFGADVGAAIVFPVGVAVAAVTIAGAGRGRGWLLVVAAPFVVLVLLALIDLITGANAHLTRSVLDAGGLGSLADVAQRRLQLSAHSFVRPVLAIFLPVVAAVAVLAIVRRDRLRAWLAGYPAVRAGLLGALAATAVGALANDSGALLLVIGAAYLLAFTGFAWAEHASARDS
jgi:hypothetical protein